VQPQQRVRVEEDQPRRLRREKRREPDSQVHDQSPASTAGSRKAITARREAKRRRGRSVSSRKRTLRRSMTTGSPRSAESRASARQAPPAGPQWVIRLRPPEPKALAYDKPLCASKDGFTLHAATRARRPGPRGAAPLPAAPTHRTGQGRAPSRRPGPHHPREALRRWHRRRGHGSAVPAPAGRERSSASPPHRPLRRGLGGSEPVAIAHRPTRRASARARKARREEAQVPLSDMGGAARAHVRHRRARLSSLPGRMRPEAS
jgi:hypothetical protein